MLDLLGFPGLALYLILGKTAVIETSFQFILLFSNASFSSEKSPVFGLDVV